MAPKRSCSWPAVRVISWSEGDSKPALGEGPKVFMLAMATSFKGNPLLLGVSSQGCSPGRNCFLFSTIITGNYFTI